MDYEQESGINQSLRSVVFWFVFICSVTIMLRGAIQPNTNQKTLSKLDTRKWIIKSINKIISQFQFMQNNSRSLSFLWSASFNIFICIHHGSMIKCRKYTNKNIFFSFIFPFKPYRKKWISHLFSPQKMCFVFFCYQ